MSDTPTPGQIAYAAWWATFGDDPPLADAYQALTPRAQAAWEAAAQAAITAWWQAHEAVICGEEET